MTIGLYQNISSKNNPEIINKALKIAENISKSNSVGVSVINKSLDDEDILYHYTNENAQIVLSIEDLFKDIIEKNNQKATINLNENRFENIEEKPKKIFLLALQKNNTGKNFGVFWILDPNLQDITLLHNLAMILSAAITNESQVPYHVSLEEKHHYETLQEVSKALEAGQIHPAYQPIVSLKQPRRIVGFEALARWRHPKRGDLAPGAFQAAFEEDAMVTRISDSILHTVIKDLNRFEQVAPEIAWIAVNVSEGQLSRSHFATDLLELAASYQVAAHKIKIELTETILLSGQAETIRTQLERLKAAGITIAFDDFGTGYASLTHLRSFPIHRLKIDRSFVQDLVHSNENRTIVGAVVHMAHELGLEVVAEGIEDQACEDALLEMGCDLGQGFYYSRPVFFDSALQLLAEPLFS